MKIENKAIKTEIQASFVAQNLQKNENKPVYLLLHGYGESGPTIFHRLKGQFPPDATLLAPNGPLVSVELKGDDLALKYAWYYFDSNKTNYLTDPFHSVNYLKDLLKELQIDHRPLHIIGYSQGGYLAPYLGRHLGDCHHVLGINCKFKEPFIGEETSFVLNAIHGEQDKVVDCKESKATFRKLKEERGFKGNFYQIEGEGHFLTLALRNKLKEVLENLSID